MIFMRMWTKMRGRGAFLAKRSHTYTDKVIVSMDREAAKLGGKSEL